MAFVVWAEKFNVGVDQLDAQHLVMASLLNHVDEAKRYQADERIISQILRTFTTCAVDHFQSEERLLDQYEYPELAEHRSLHRSMERELADRIGSHEQALSAAASDEVVTFITLWLDDHLLKADMRYKRFLTDAMNGHGGNPTG